MIHFITTVLLLLSINTTTPNFGSDQHGTNSKPGTEQTGSNAQTNNIVTDDLMGV